MSKIVIDGQTINLNDLDATARKAITRAADASKKRKEKAWNIFLRAFETDAFKEKLAKIYSDYQPTADDSDNISAKLLQRIATEYHSKGDVILDDPASLALEIRNGIRKKKVTSESGDFSPESFEPVQRVKANPSPVPQSPASVHAVHPQMPTG